jgi:hypothetical protein
MHFRIIGPDGISDSEEAYESREQAEDALSAYIDRFAVQGYYSSATGENFSMTDLLRLTEIAGYEEGDEGRIGSFAELRLIDPAGHDENDRPHLQVLQDFAIAEMPPKEQTPSGVEELLQVVGAVCHCYKAHLVTKDLATRICGPACFAFMTAEEH